MLLIELLKNMLLIELLKNMLLIYIDYNTLTISFGRFIVFNYEQSSDVLFAPSNSRRKN